MSLSVVPVSTVYHPVLHSPFSLVCSEPQDTLICISQVLCSLTPCCIQPVGGSSQRPEQRRSKERCLSPSPSPPHRSLAEATLLSQTPQVPSRGPATQPLALVGRGYPWLNAAATLWVLHYPLLIPMIKVLKTVLSFNNLQLTFGLYHLFPSGNFLVSPSTKKYIISNPNFPLKKLKLREIK